MIDFEHEYLMNSSEARIKVLGIGGAGCNTVNHMLKAHYQNVDFLAANTDAQSLKVSDAPFKIQIGTRSTRGRGAGANAEIGRRAAEEDRDKIVDFLKDSDIVFLTAGLGGGTGSGAIPVIARAVREMGILCVAVVTKPFMFEGKKRAAVAEAALELLKKEVDTLIVIPNEKLINIADSKLSLINAFAMINDVTHQFVKSISDIISRPGHINVDFADVCTIMRSTGIAVMGTGRAQGEDRAQRAALQALASPLLESTSIQGARAVLLNITGSSDLSLHEVHAAASLVYDEAPDANIIMGSVIDENMQGEVFVTIIATGMDSTHVVEEPMLVAQRSHDRSYERTSDRSFDRNSDQALDKTMHPAPEYGAPKIQERVVERPLHAREQIREHLQEASSPQEPYAFEDYDAGDLEVPTYLRRSKERGMDEVI